MVEFVVCCRGSTTRGGSTTGEVVAAVVEVVVVEVVVVLALSSLGCKTEAILSVGLILWSDISIDAEAGVSQFKSMLAFASLGTGETESGLESGVGSTSKDRFCLRCCCC